MIAIPVAGDRVSAPKKNTLHSFHCHNPSMPYVWCCAALCYRRWRSGRLCPTLQESREAQGVSYPIWLVLGTFCLTMLTPQRPCLFWCSSPHTRYTEARYSTLAGCSRRVQPQPGPQLTPAITQAESASSCCSAADIVQPAGVKCVLFSSQPPQWRHLVWHLRLLPAHPTPAARSCQALSSLRCCRTTVLKQPCWHACVHYSCSCRL
jgi:hypothetical protein